MQLNHLRNSTRLGRFSEEIFFIQGIPLQIFSNPGLSDQKMDIQKYRSSYPNKISAENKENICQ